MGEPPLESVSCPSDLEYERKIRLDSLLNNDIKTFEQHLTSDDVVEYIYGYPHYKTCLDIACSRPGKSGFVKLLLDKNSSNINKKNDRNENAPLHFAAETGDPDTIKELLSCDTIDVNNLSIGRTALFLAINVINKDDEESRMKYLDPIKQLVVAGTDINIPDKKNRTPLNLAAQKDLKDVIEIIIEYSKNPIDLDLEDWEGKTARNLITKKFPNYMEKLSGKEISKDTVTYHMLFAHLNNHYEDQFIQDFEKIKETDEHFKMDNNDKWYDFLAFACTSDLYKVVEFLLNNGADPNYTGIGNYEKPIEIVCSNGHHRSLEKIMTKSEIDVEMLLHKTIKEYRNNENLKRDYNKCIDILLEKIEDINYIDDKKNTALHYAVKRGYQNTILSLLKKGADIGLLNYNNKPILVDIPAKTLQKFFDTCLITNKERLDDDDYEIQFDYQFLEPHQPDTKNLDTENSSKEDIELNEITPTNDQLESANNDDESPNDSDTIKDNNKSHEIKKRAPETVLLMHMNENSELKPLLKHPVITSFLELKWKWIIMFYNINVFLYTLFFFSLNIHIYLTFNANDTDNIVGKVMKSITVICLTILLLRETIQIVVAPKKYFQSGENVLEISLFIITCIMMFQESIKKTQMQELYSIVILLSATELILIYSQYPPLSTNIIMLKTIIELFEIPHLVLHFTLGICFQLLYTIL
ncbi:transient receptor potential cation channel protein painless-like [Arctopsyche grandis]|uniref:transient receptor potential cation channel protein painless-like n=1 Tax=Arctopsyche grandis TaxID=121162 RepID=UPI00406D81B8